MSQSCRFVILISGRGSNMEAIVDALSGLQNAKVVAVMSNEPEAAGLAWAQEKGIATRTVCHRDYTSRESFDKALAKSIDGFNPDYVLLAGFMRILTPGFANQFEGRLINIHPSLLPAFPGLHTHRQALAFGVQWHGCTVHFVTHKLDHGPVIAQGIVPVHDGDTEAELARRVLAMEHQVYGQVACWLADGRVQQHVDGTVTVAGIHSRAFGPQLL